MKPTFHTLQLPGASLKLFPFVICVLASCVALCSAVLISQDQLNALVRLKSSLDPRNVVLNSWREDIPTCDSWKGLTCSAAGEVLKISLASSNLDGTLSEDVGALTKLVILDLSINSLFGFLPKSIGNLSSLQELLLNQNSFQGKIPRALPNLSKLLTLDLSVNRLSGTLPNSIGSLRLLQYLHVGTNSLSGVIPASISNLVDLVELNLSFNDFSGSIPSDISKLSKLNQLSLSSNRLKGSIPPGIVSLRNTSIILLGKNQLYGEIPANIGAMKSLASLDVSFNNLTGTIPESLGQLTGLSGLDLSFNQLSGPIPSSIGSITSLNTLRIEVNQLNGTLPDSLGTLPTLAYLVAASNHLSGVIPESFGGLSLLFVLDLSGNQLNGSIPSSLGSLFILQRMDLSDNSLSGPIPPSLSGCSSLMELDLRSNSLSGTIPPSLGSLSTLEYLDLSQNQFKGTIGPNVFQNMASLSAISLLDNSFSGPLPSLPQSTNNINFGYNFFNGSLPDSYSKLKNLNILQLAFNNLSGSLPQSLLGMSNLVKIDFEANSLSGGLPLYYPSTLQTINIEDNKLSGGISASFPNSLTSIPKLNSLFLGNNLLSGIVSSFRSPSLTYISLFNNQLTGVASSLVDSTGNVISSSQTLVLYGNPWCRNPSFQLSTVCSSSSTTASSASNSSQSEHALLSWSPTPFCPSPANSPCPYGQSYSTSLWFLQGKCACQEYIYLNVLLIAPFFSVFTSQIATELVQTLASVLKDFVTNQALLTVNQIWVASAQEYPAEQQFVSLQFFTQTGSVWNPTVAAKILGALFNGAKYSNLLGEKFGPYLLRDVYLDSSTIPLPPSPPAPVPNGSNSSSPSPSSSSPSPSSSISSSSSPVLIIVIAVVVVIVLVIAAAFLFLFVLRKKRPPAGMSEALVKSMPVHSLNIQSSHTKRISLAAVITATDNFAAENLLGEGAHGAVFKGIAPGNEKELWAVKRAKVVTAKGLEMLANEIESVSKVSHRNLVRLLGYCDEGNEQILIYEFVSNGNLQQHLRPKIWRGTKPVTASRMKSTPNSAPNMTPNSGSNMLPKKGPKSAIVESGSTAPLPPKPPHRSSKDKNETAPSDLAGGAEEVAEDAGKEVEERVFKYSPLSFEQRLDIAIGSAEGLHYLHSFADPGIIHRDVKSENILLTEKMQPKLADFGLLKNLKEEDRSEALSTRVAGTPGYMDPEYYRTFKVTTKSDVYSFGVVLLELISGKPPAMAQSFFIGGQTNPATSSAFQNNSKNNNNISNNNGNSAGENGYLSATGNEVGDKESGFRGFGQTGQTGEQQQHTGTAAGGTGGRTGTGTALSLASEGSRQSHLITIAEWAFPLIVNGDIHSLADPRLFEIENCPLEPVAQMASVAFQCIHKYGSERPDMGDVVRMLSEIKNELKGQYYHADYIPNDSDIGVAAITEFGSSSSGFGVGTSTNPGGSVDPEKTFAPTSMILSGR